MPRDRSCGALIVDGRILMVQHREPNRTFWTLPGGGVDPGETPEDAAVREMFEETGCRTRAVRLLYSGPWSTQVDGMGYCFLMEPLDAEAERAIRREIVTGFDPEEAHLSVEERQLRSAGWKTLDEMSEDGQVREVLRALASER